MLNTHNILLRTDGEDLSHVTLNVPKKRKYGSLNTGAFSVHRTYLQSLIPCGYINGEWKPAYGFAVAFSDKKPGGKIVKISQVSMMQELDKTTIVAFSSTLNNKN